MQMRIFPSIIQHGNQESSQNFQIHNQPMLINKQSIASFDSQVSKINKTNATLNSINSPILQSPGIQQEFHFKKQAKQCRICLENSLENQKQLIKICKCSGSIEFVHQFCFKSWIEKSLQHKNKQERTKILRKRQIDCQMCKQKIKIQFQEENHWATLAQIKKSIHDKPKMFAFILVLFLGTLASFIYLIISLSIKGIALSKQDEKFYESLFSICSLVLMVVLNAISLFFMVQEFFVKSQIKVKLRDKGFSSSKSIRKSSITTTNHRFLDASQIDNCPDSPLHIQPIPRKIQEKKRSRSQRKRYSNSQIQEEFRPPSLLDRKRVSSPQMMPKQKILPQNKPPKMSHSLNLTLHQVIMSDQLSNIQQL